MEVVAEEVDGVHLGIGDFDACRIGVAIELAAHLEAGVGGGGGDQLDDDLVADEWLAAPVLGDEREQAMLDLVPLAGAGRQVADRDGEAEFVGQLLQLDASTGARATPLLPPQSAVISKLLSRRDSARGPSLATSGGWR